MNTRRILPHLATVAAVPLLLALLAACGSDLQDDEEGGAPDGALSAIEPEGAPAEEGGDAVVQSGSSDGSVSDQRLPSVSDRKITRTATLRLDVKDILRAVSDVEGIALDAGGFVSRSSVFVDDEGSESQSASVTIRVPDDSYSSVMNRLRGIAEEVKSENSEATEVTEEYTDLEARLRNLQATERRYQELLAQAAGINEVLSLEDRMRAVRGEIEQVQGRLNVLNDLVDLATITVELTLPPAVPGDAGGRGWAKTALEESWQASMDVAVVVGTITIALVVFLPWLLIPGAAALAGWRLFGRRLSGWAQRIGRL